MKLTVAFFQALVALTIASPFDPLEPRQGIDTSLVDSAPTPTSVSVPVGPTADSTTYNLTEATESATANPLPVETEPITRRDVYARQTACQPNPTGAGPVPTPDTDGAFLSLRAFARIARQAPTPTGYNETFQNLHARVEAYGYLGFNTLSSYDTQNCASQCDNIWRGCIGFNIFFERDPSLNPGQGCQNPPSTTNIKCIFWGGTVSRETATNDGQYQANFHVVIAGSNGYMKNAIPTVPGYEGEPTGNNTIDVPPDDMDPGDTTSSSVTTTSTSTDSTTSTDTTSTDTTTSTDSTTSTTSTDSTSSTSSITSTSTSSSTSTTTSSSTSSTTTSAPGGRGSGRGGTYIGSRIFTNSYFDPSLCAAACDAQNRNNLANPPSQGQPQICRFFTTYLILRNGQPAGQYCALYTQYYSPQFATNSGTRSGGDTLAVRNAYSYRNLRNL